MGQAAAARRVHAKGRLTDLRAVLRQWTRRLELVSDEAEVEARLIACHLLRIEPGHLPLYLSRPAPDELRASAEPILAGRIRRVPLPYLLGEVHFRDLRLKCDPRAAVPRPETELLVDIAVEWLAGRRAVVVDVGTGSGCIACSVAATCPDATVIATDISPLALALATDNARALGLDHRITFLEGNLLEPLLPAGLARRVSAVVANLPYLTPDDYAAGQAELRREPREALVAGPTGLELYHRLINQLAALPTLRFVAFEVGAGQAERVSRALSVRLASWPHGGQWRLSTSKDYGGHDRVVCAQR